MKTAFFLCLCAAFSLAAASCASVGEIPEGTQASKLIQMGQEAADRGNYKGALRCYQTVLDRYPDDREMTCAAQYESALIHAKRGPKEEAREAFEALLRRYEEPDAVFLPQKYLTLSKIMLKRLGEK